MSQDAESIEVIPSNMLLSYDTVHPKISRPDWSEERLFGFLFALPPEGLSRIDKRTLLALIQVGRIKPRMEVTVQGKTFVLMPRHFRRLAMFIPENRHLIVDQSKRLRWCLEWLPAAEELTAQDEKRTALLEAEAAAMRDKALSTPFREKRRADGKRRRMNAAQCSYLIRSYKARAILTADRKKRAYWFYKHFKMKQLLPIIQDEEARGIHHTGYLKPTDE